MRCSSVMRSWLIRVALVAVTPAAATAQDQRLVITPFAGGIVPTTILGDLRIAGLTPQPFVFQGEIKAAGVLGARLDLWAGPRWGVTGAYFNAPTEFRVTSGPFFATVPAKVQGGSFKGFFRATGGDTGTDLVVSAGVSGVHHGGRAFALASEQFDVGGAVGGGLHVRMTDIATFRIDGDLLIYRWSAGPSFTPRTQTDVVMTAGLGLRLSR